MGNCSCLERARVTAWDDDDGDWGLPAERTGGGARSTAEDGGTRVKIRMTKGQLRRLLESAGHKGAPDEDVVAEIMSMGTGLVDVAKVADPRPPKLETIQEDDLDE